MKNTTLGAITLTIILIVGYFFLGSEKVSGETITGNVVAADTLKGDIQKVVISEKDLNYYPQEIRVKANQPVSISLDNKVKGCLRSFTIRDLGVSKYLKSVSDTLEFTPTKTGTFAFSCSMGMGFGKLIVE